jgi:CRISPR-associated protein Csb2
VTHLLLTVRFLDDRYHGLLDRGGPPEWPPSPFRLFQALVAGVGRRGELDSPIGQSLGLLQKLEPPIIIAPKSKTGQAITRFVPNNDGDKKFDRQERLTAKPTIPTLMLLESEEKPEIHYIWDISSHLDAPVNQIRDAARSLTTLGWGIDMAFADARLATEDDIQKLKGIRWYPKKNAGSFRDTLRTPTYDAEMGECTLCDLRHCHSTFINRIEHGKPLKTVDKPKIFDRVLYTSVERPACRPHAVFKLLDPNEDPARYPHAKLVHIAGMVRHLAIKAMTDAGADADFVNRVVRGKRDPCAGDEHKQISYVPLPSIGYEHADGIIRNVMLVVPIGMERELADLAHRINGQPLKPEGEFGECKSDLSPTEVYRAELRLFTPPANKFIDTHYLGTSRTWQTVTPVILDGHNKKSKADRPAAIARETEKLICKALQRADIETPCKFTWQTIPFLKNCLSAHKYDGNGRHTGYHRPAHLKDLTAVHVQLMFDHPVPGPITIGAGRHCGLGTFTAVDEGKS